MISWMQENRKYLVVTLWISAFAFIGAGFVGWGSYQYGSKATSIAKVGSVDIKLSELQMAYSNLYAYYNQMFGGKLDQEIAKELKLEESAFNILKREALLLNLAEEFGLKVLDQEIADNIIKNESFFNNGKFDRNQYELILKNNRISLKDYEHRLAKSILISKIRELFPATPTNFEKELFSSVLTLKDKIEYKILSIEDINVSISDNEISAFWELNKNKFLTEQEFKISFIETNIADRNYSDAEQQEFYNTNGLKYESSFEDSRNDILKDMRERDSKRDAMRDYLSFKKGEYNGSIQQSQILSLNNLVLSTVDEDLSELKIAKINDIFKPQISKDRSAFLTIRIDEIIQPREKTFDEVKNDIEIELKAQKSKEAILNMAKETYTNFSGKQTEFLSVADGSKIEGLFPQDGSEFLSSIFTTGTNKGFIPLGSKVVLYKIIEQMIDNNQQEQDLSTQILEVKERVFEDNLIKKLEYYYPVQTYFKG